MKRRILSMILAVSMMLTLLPVSAFADTGGAETGASSAVESGEGTAENPRIIATSRGLPSADKGTGWYYEDNTLYLTDGVFTFVPENSAGGYDYGTELRFNLNIGKNATLLRQFASSGVVTNYGTMDGALYDGTQGDTLNASLENHGVVQNYSLFDGTVVYENAADGVIENCLLWIGSDGFKNHGTVANCVSQTPFDGTYSITADCYFQLKLPNGFKFGTNDNSSHVLYVFGGKGISIDTSANVFSINDVNGKDPSEYGTLIKNDDGSNVLTLNENLTENLVINRSNIVAETGEGTQYSPRQVLLSSRGIPLLDRGESGTWNYTDGTLYLTSGVFAFEYNETLHCSLNVGADATIINSNFTCTELVSNYGTLDSVSLYGSFVNYGTMQNCTLSASVDGGSTFENASGGVIRDTFLEIDEPFTVSGGTFENCLSRYEIKGFHTITSKYDMIVGDSDGISYYAGFDNELERYIMYVIGGKGVDINTENTPFKDVNGKEPSTYGTLSTNEGGEHILTLNADLTEDIELNRDYTLPEMGNGTEDDPRYIVLINGLPIAENGDSGTWSYKDDTLYLTSGVFTFNGDTVECNLNIGENASVQNCWFDCAKLVSNYGTLDDVSLYGSFVNYGMIQESELYTSENVDASVDHHENASGGVIRNCFLDVGKKFTVSGGTLENCVSRQKLPGSHMVTSLSERFTVVSPDNDDSWIADMDDETDRYVIYLIGCKDYMLRLDNSTIKDVNGKDPSAYGTLYSESHILTLSNDLTEDIELNQTHFDAESGEGTEEKPLKITLRNGVPAAKEGTNWYYENDTLHLEKGVFSFGDNILRCSLTVEQGTTLQESGIFCDTGTVQNNGTLNSVALLSDFVNDGLIINSYIAKDLPDYASYSAENGAAVYQNNGTIQNCVIVGIAISGSGELLNSVSDLELPGSHTISISSDLKGRYMVAPSEKCIGFFSGRSTCYVVGGKGMLMTCENRDEFKLINGKDPSEYGTFSHSVLVLDADLTEDLVIGAKEAPTPAPESSYDITIENDYGTAQNANGKTITSAKKGDKVYLKADKLPENYQLKSWSVVSPAGLTLKKDKKGTYFIMPGEAVTIKANLSKVNLDPDNPEDPDKPSDPNKPSNPGTSDSSDDGAAVAIIGVAGAAAGVVGYFAGTQIYLTSVLPKGAAIPTNRQALAVLLWETAGKPEPAATTAYTDLTEDTAQKAAQWCVEQGLIPAKGEDTFLPSNYVTRIQVIKSWNALQKLLKQ